MRYQVPGTLSIFLGQIVRVSVALHVLFSLDAPAALPAVSLVLAIFCLPLA